MNKGLKVLIVEDDPYSYLLLEKYLKPLNPEIIWVRSGLKAIETVQKKPDIHLVFMDISIEDLNGYETTRRIKQVSPEILVIAQTAHALPGDREKALQAGCDDYIAKPFQIHTFTKLLKKYGIMSEPAEQIKEQEVKNGSAY